MNRVSCPLVLLAALALVTACENPTPLITGKGRLVLEADAVALAHGDALDLGEALPGASVERTLLIRNTGTAPLTVAGHRTSPPEFAVLGGADEGCAPLSLQTFSIEPGGCRAARVRFEASEEGPAQATWTLDHDGEGPRQVVLLAAAWERRLAVCVLDEKDGAPAELCASITGRDLGVDFGAVAAGTVAKRLVRFGNVGRAPVEVQPFDVLPAPDPELALEGIEFPLRLAPGEWRTAELWFVPAEPGEHAVRFTIHDPSPRVPPLVLALRGDARRPMLCPDPAAVEFQNVLAHLSSGFADLRLSNCGNEALRVSDLVVSGNGFFGPQGWSAKTLQPGETETVRLRFSPAETGPHQGALTVATNDPLAPIGEISLRGKGVACRLDISPLALDFGTMIAESVAEKSVLLRNAGDGECQLPRRQLDPAAVMAGYGIAAFTATAPLGPGESAEMVVRFRAPGTQGPHDGAMLVETLDPETREYVETRISLTGRSIPLTGCRLEWKGGVQNGCTLDFGGVKQNQSRELEVLLENVGDEACEVLPPSLGVATDIVFSTGAHPQPFPATVPPGGTVGVHVRFSPGSQWGRWGEDPRNRLTVQSNSRAFGTCSGRTIEIQLKGHVAYGALDAVPSRLDFGKVRSGCAGSEREVRVYNAGTANVTLSSVALGGSAAFSLASPPATPHPLPPGQFLSIPVRFAPTSASRAEAATLRIHHDLGTAPLEVQLAGDTVTATRRTDHFIQTRTPQADVLWVVDNSGSMANKQELMPPNADRFVQALHGADVDLRMAVIGVDWGEAGSGSGWPHVADQTSAYPGATIRAGEFFGVPQIIDSADPNPAGALARNIRIGECCADTAEGGLEAARVALSPPLTLDPSKPNGSFLRPGAKLSVIVLSDEDDQSPAIDVGYYVDFLQSLKGGASAELVELHAVTAGDTTGCAIFHNGETITAEAAPRYLEVVRQTGGIHRLICSSDWGYIATDLANRIAAPQRAFVLSGEPEPWSLLVFVNGTRAFEGSDYDFDPVTSTVTFRPTRVPPRGAEILAEYDPRCR